LGVKPGDTVAIMDWDTRRYLECFFAVLMMGAVLHTVNVRLSAEQILYSERESETERLMLDRQSRLDVWRRTSNGDKRRQGRPVEAFSEKYRRQICPRGLVVQPQAHQRHWLNDPEAILEAPTKKI
jgi:acyl-CoA synthetase (AMP-forming)/AMP-acid ligase II